MESDHAHHCVNMLAASSLRCDWDCIRYSTRTYLAVVGFATFPAKFSVSVNHRLSFSTLMVARFVAVPSHDEDSHDDEEFVRHALPPCECWNGLVRASRAADYSIERCHADVGT